MMEHLDYPSPELWKMRRDWFEAKSENLAGQGNYLVSEQACALIVEVQSVFCVGAWAAVIILSMAVIDAQLRESEVPGFSGSTARLLAAAEANPDIHQLRRRRNSLIHVAPDNPALTVDDQWSNRRQLEDEARQAVHLMFEAFYIGPWS
jgi:hypothetical protein